MMEEIVRLERELKETRDKIVRICKWIREEHGIIVPEFILKPLASDYDSDGNPPEDTYINRKIELLQDQGVNIKEEQFDENNDLSSNFDENDYIEERPSKLPSKVKDLFLKCKPCYVLLPPRIDHQPHHKDQIKPDTSTFSKLKIKPTVDERMRALYICQTYSTASTNTPIICPITSCSHYFPHCKYIRGMFTRHLTRMHFFHQLEVKKPIRFTLENTQVDKILQKKPSIINNIEIKSTIEFEKDILKPTISDIDQENDETCSNLSLILPDINYDQNNDEIKISPEETRQNLHQNWRKRKKEPTLDEKKRALEVYKTTDSFLKVKCPICSVNIISANDCRSGFKRHLIRIHYFNVKELNILHHKGVKRSTNGQNKAENVDEIEKPPEKKHYVYKRHKLLEQRQKRPTFDEKKSALEVYKTTGSFLKVKCPICLVNIINNNDCRSGFKRHLIRIHCFDEDELNILHHKGVKRSTSDPDRIKLCKKRPTVEEKTFALELYKSSASYLIVKCPICPVRIKNINDSRSGFKFHLIRMHYFTEEEFKYQKDKIKITKEQKIQILQVLEDYTDSPEDIGKPLICPACPGTKFSDDGHTVIGLKTRFKSHLKKIHNFTNQDFLTDTDQVYKVPERKKYKRSRPHGQQTGSLCTICGKIFTQINYLRKHHVKFHSDAKPTFQCDTCSIYFHYKDDLRVHKIVHSTVRNHMCHVCSSSFKTFHDLRGHLLIHSEDRQFNCLYENCGKSFKHPQSFKAHIRIYHTEGGNVKKFHCDKCDLSFIHGYTLKFHLRTVHGNIRPFQCTLCSLAFKTTSNLKNHIRTHSNNSNSMKKRGLSKPKDL